jgi:hypothetical protein
MWVKIKWPDLYHFSRVMQHYNTKTRGKSCQYVYHSVLHFQLRSTITADSDNGTEVFKLV